jgi:hypothetical protein
MRLLPYGNNSIWHRIKLWEQISAEMDYSWRQINRLHSKAIRNLLLHRIAHYLYVNIKMPKKIENVFGIAYLLPAVERHSSAVGFLIHKEGYYVISFT